MKQNYILVVILFAILSVVNAIPHQLHKRAITFTECPTGSLNPIIVSIEPDPPLNNQPAIFTISAVLKTGLITEGSMLAISAIDGAGNFLGEHLIDAICGIPKMTCPTNNFTITKSVSLQNFPATYHFIIQILDASGKSLGCTVGTST